MPDPIVDPTPAPEAPENDILDGIGPIDEADETPAEPADETPAEVEETPEAPAEPDHIADAPAVADEAPKPAEPVADEPAPKTEPVATEPVIDPYDTELQQWVADYREIQAKIAEDPKSIDPLENGGKGFEQFAKMTMKGMAMLDHKIARVTAPINQTLQQQQAAAVAQQQQAAAQKYWDDFTKSTPELANPRKVYADLHAAAVKQYGPGAAADAVADERWNQKVAQVKSAPKPAAVAKPAAIKPPVTKGGAQVSPASGAARPAPVKKTDEDELAAAIGAGIHDVW